MDYIFKEHLWRAKINTKNVDLDLFIRDISNIKWMKILDIKYFNSIFMIYFNDSIVTCRINKDSTTIVNLF